MRLLHAARRCALTSGWGAVAVLRAGRSTRADSSAWPLVTQFVVALFVGLRYCPIDVGSSTFTSWQLHVVA